MYIPLFEVSTLPLLSGGINFPDFSSECHIRIAKLIAQCFNPEPPIWIKCLNLLTLNSFQKSLPNLILNNIAPYSAPYPIKSILSSAKKIHLRSPLILTTSPSLPSLRNITLHYHYLLSLLLITLVLFLGKKFIIPIILGKSQTFSGKLLTKFSQLV